MLSELLCRRVRRLPSRAWLQGAQARDQLLRRVLLRELLLPRLAADRLPAFEGSVLGCINQPRLDPNQTMRRLVSERIVKRPEFRATKVCLTCYDLIWIDFLEI